MQIYHAPLPIVRATKTLVEIEAALQADGGKRYRALLQELLPQAADAYSQDDFPFRAHLGASLIGRECDRALWYGYRWVTREKFSGRMLRLFNRGHLEEARLIALLRMIGCEVFQRDSQGRQFRFDDRGFGGSLDGVVEGLPDLPSGEACLLECKTHNRKSFDKLRALGVRETKPDHVAQMITYDEKFSLSHALYFAACKDDDDLHAEILSADPASASTLNDRAQLIIHSIGKVPKKISDKPTWFACSYCPHKPVCHQGAQPERTCRTCARSSVDMWGKWLCLRDDAPRYLDKHAQLAGCPDYALSPLLKR